MLDDAYMPLLEAIRDAYARILGAKLTGIYVHGSIAFGCFRWEISDVDYLAVVEAPLTPGEKQALLTATVRLNRDAPPKGLEMSVVLRTHCARFVHPTPFELHFSNAHIEAYRQDAEGYCACMCGVDYDLAAHFTVIRKVGRVLCGPSIAQVFGPVADADYFDSIRLDIENAAEEVASNPVYVLLNLCRVLAYKEEKRVLSKREGGLWALKSLRDPVPACVRWALAQYTGDVALPLDEEEAVRFCKAMCTRILA